MNRRLLVVTVAASSLAVAQPSSFTYRFDEVKSKVLRAPRGDEKNEIRVTVGDAAAPGDLVRTGFWARTVVSVPERKARFEIASSTRARLAPGEPGVLLLVERGRLKAFFEALTDGSAEERRVAAPGALLAVRGTRYGLEVDGEGRSLLAVFEGTVEVLSTVPGVSPIRVHADEFCTFGPKAAPKALSMRSVGMNEGSWGMHGGTGGMSPGNDGRMPQTSGRPMQGGSPMGHKGP